MSKYEIITVGNLRTDSIYFLGSPPRAATATNDDKKPIKVWRRLGLIETPSIVFCVPFQPFSGSSNWWVCSTSIILNERPSGPGRFFTPAQNPKPRLDLHRGAFDSDNALSDSTLYYMYPWCIESPWVDGFSVKKKKGLTLNF